MRKIVVSEKGMNSESGVTLIEVMLAMLIMLITTLSIMGVMTTAIGLNNRNKIGSTGTMLAQAVIEQIKATIIGSETSALVDCALNTWTIDTAPGGATLNGSNIDFTQTSPPANYYMNYVVKSPCTSSGTYIRTYDVRWNVAIVGASASPPAPTNTYIITMGARLLNHSEGNLIYPEAVNFRVLAGN
jgi:type II secretory pathway pseudopilin PulG